MGFATQFLSTPSARRATLGPVAPGRTKQFLSTPSARRATAADPLCGLPLLYFYPRPPRGGRPRRCRSGSYGIPISIHALREEGDSLTMPLSRSRSHFYPRPPRGGRRAMRGCGADPGIFLSTPSARRATRRLSSHSRRTGNFYPRPPRGGRPADAAIKSLGFQNFYPRPPRGGRRKSGRP